MLLKIVGGGDMDGESKVPIITIYNSGRMEGDTRASFGKRDEREDFGNFNILSKNIRSKGVEKILEVSIDELVNVKSLESLREVRNLENKRGIKVLEAIHKEELGGIQGMVTEEDGVFNLNLSSLSRLPYDLGGSDFLEFSKDLGQFLGATLVLIFMGSPNYFTLDIVTSADNSFNLEDYLERESGDLRDEFDNLGDWNINIQKLEEDIWEAMGKVVSQ